MGHADLLFWEAADALAEAGCDHEAALIRREIVGRNVLDGGWTFQVVDEFDDSYYEPVRATERHVRDRLVAGHRHVYEAELKDTRRTNGHPDRSRRPVARSDQPRSWRPTASSPHPSPRCGLDVATLG